MSRTQVEQCIDFFENNGYIVVSVIYTNNTSVDVCDIIDENDLDGVVGFNVMPLSDYEANGFQV